jgi:hypothetical protein
MYRIADQSLLSLMLGQIPDLDAPARGFYDVSKYVATKFPMKRQRAEHAKLKRLNLT